MSVQSLQEQALEIADKYTFYTTAEYFAELVQHIEATGPGERVVLATMTFEPTQPKVRGVVDALVAAAERGVLVQLLVDAKLFLLPGSDRSVGVRPGPLFFNTELPLKLRGRLRVAYEALEAVRTAGGQYVIINQPGRRFTNPIAGRSHIKFAVVGSRVYTGGCNLDSDEHTDVMVGWDDAKMGDQLAELAVRVAMVGVVKTALEGRDLVMPVDDDATLLVDAGARGQSVILTQALELIDAASEFVLVSGQFFPNDVTARHLLAAHRRGVRVQLLYNHPSQFDVPHNWLHHGVVTQARRRLPPEFFATSQRGAFFHAKVVVTEQSAMVGSHNFVAVGVKLGTAEIALLVQGREFGQEVLAALERQIPHKLVQ